MADWSIAPLSSQWATRGGSKYACAALRADIANLCIFNHDTTVAATCSVTQAAVEKLGTGVAGCRHRHEGLQIKPELDAEHQNHHLGQGMSSSSHYASINNSNYYGQNVNGTSAPSSEIMGPPRHEMDS
ncbi:hypothetical protein E4U13_000294 [Claviceps humidiphila]|uniref:Uncharacterized protein n=1 Tax=Claviceps humidiphila TaxID=1294629 RepID=A0A9P7TS03_9HYPO|nr:hypothetical protein E4U13_000294 [Claviceps humidiphila]